MNFFGIDLSPLVACGLAGLLWTLIQAALDRPWWTATRRRVIVLVAGCGLAVVIWAIGAYPATWELFVTQATVIIGAASAAFTVLKSVGAIDWIGRVTPGGEAYQPKHAASTVNVPTVPEATVLAASPGSGDASPRAPANGAGVTAVPNTEGSSLEGEDPTA